jgi:hypothetical protein
MKQALTLLVAGALTALAGTASAQEPRARTADEPVTHYTFGDELVPGDLVRPEGEILQARRRHGRGTLIRPRWHFVPELMKSVERL